jgi:rSAM/selenodomain-associated transferase 1
MSTAALLMLKAPRPGFVKTRLAAAIGPDAACAAYRAMAEKQLREIPMGWARVVHFAPADGCAEMQEWLGDGCFYAPQADGDLGARMSAAARDAATKGFARAILLGGDCPWITRELLLRAEQELAAHDLVIGPATDGGYYLLGMNAGKMAPFSGIEWSTEHVLKQTLTQAEEAGLSVCLLPELEDVDDAAGWERAQGLLKV